ncbi:MAG: hypothetical protein O3A01_08025 [bacterium]|nr:hypothetical protein [bacterium]
MLFKPYEGWNVEQVVNGSKTQYGTEFGSGALYRSISNSDSFRFIPKLDSDFPKTLSDVVVDDDGIAFSDAHALQFVLQEGSLVSRDTFRFTNLEGLRSYMGG